MKLFQAHDIKSYTTDLAGHNRMAADLLDRLRDVKRTNFANTAWISPLPCPQGFPGVNIQTPDQMIQGDIEQFVFAENTMDLIVICGGLDIVNDLPGVLVQIRRSLKPDGLFLCALPGGETLHELRDSLSRVELERRGGASPRIHPMIDLQTWASLLQRAGFALPVADSEIVPVSYRSLKTLLRDLKKEGGLNLLQRDKNFVGRDFWHAVESDYRARHCDRDGNLKTSFEILYGIGWGPAATQQKPLRPGSAQNRLADALNTDEKPLPR